MATAAFFALMETPDELRACDSAGECIVHENGVCGLDYLHLSVMVVSRRVYARTMRRVFCALRKERRTLEGWVIL